MTILEAHRLYQAALEAARVFPDSEAVASQLEQAESAITAAWLGLTDEAML